jgi:hypothetical protein
VSASPAVDTSGDGATASAATQGYGPRPAEQLEDAPTIEFAPGLRRPISLGTPPPPPTHLFETRLGRPGRGPRPLRVLVPVVAAGMVLAAIGVGMTLKPDIRTSGPPNAPVARTTEARTVIGPAVSTADASTSASPASPSSPAASTTSPPGLQAPPQPAPNSTEPTQTAVPTQPTVPTLTTPGAVPFGQPLFLNANSFPCGADARVIVTISRSGVEYVVFEGASPTDPQGHASVHIYVQPDGQVAIDSGPPAYVTVTPGEWVVKASVPAQTGCTSASSATATVTITS